MHLPHLAILPATLGILYNILSPFLSHILPLNKKVVHVRSLDQRVDTVHEYPILDFIGLIEKHGYTGNEYNVTTSDGYILRLHRITSSPVSSKQLKKKVIYLQHGIGLSSDSWVLIGPNKDLAFLLADSGYDVWLGNARGNVYSKSHTFKSAKNANFWDFSYHEMACYDAPAFIDFILNETGAKKLTYFGYSMGTTILYVMLSERPEYNNKIELAYTMAPVALWHHGTKGLLRFLDVIINPLKDIISYFKFNQLLPQNALTAFIGSKFCGDDNDIMQPLCAYLYSFIGLDHTRMNKTALPSISTYLTTGMSVRTFIHYNENYKTGKFQPLNYNGAENQRRYGTNNIQAYDLTNVKVPVIVIYSKADDVALKEDVEDLIKQLPNVIDVKKVQSNTFNHFDFLWGIDAKRFVYDYVLNNKKTDKYYN